MMWFRSLWFTGGAWKDSKMHAQKDLNVVSSLIGPQKARMLITVPGEEMSAENNNPLGGG